MKEQWKKICFIEKDKKYDYSDYDVSNLGRIRNKQGKIMSLAKKNNGYMIVTLCKNGKPKSFYVHKLVAIHFIHNPNCFPQINHKDENKENNDVNNLEWCTIKYNVNYGTRNEKCRNKMKGRKLKGKAKEISENRKTKVIGISIKNNKVIILNYIMQGELIGINHSSISRCCNGKQKTAGGYIWKYLNSDK